MDNTNEKELGKFNLTKNESGYRLQLDFTPLGRNLDRAQFMLDTQVWLDVQKYMPLDSGALKSETNVLNANTSGKVYMYPPNSDYGHYLYEGIVYVDPIYQKAAFYSPEYGFWSRPGVRKVPSERKLTFSQPNAEAHWGEVAFNNHKDEWVEVVKRALQ